jgi:hypothetical protein
VLVIVALLTGTATLSIGFYLVDPCPTCSGATKSITLASANLYSGVTASGSSDATANLAMTINNPGATVYISSLSLYGGYKPSTGPIANVTPRLITTTSTLSDGLLIAGWQNSNLSAIDFQIHSANNRLATEKVSFFDFYPTTSTPLNITAGYVYNYFVNFTNGVSISGSLLAQ